MADILPKDLPVGSLPLAPTDVIIVEQGSGVNRTTAEGIVDSVAPVATQAESVAGLNNVKRMTSLGVKQSIASEAGVTIATYAQGQAADTAVQPARSISAGAGLEGGGSLAADRTISLNAASIASLALADSAAQGATTFAAGAGLTGGGTLAANRTIALNGASIASLALADSAVQPAGLTKAAVGLGNVDNTSDANKPVSTAQAAALAGKFNNPTGTTAQYLRGDGTPAAFPAIPAGTVTSVGLSVPTGFTASGSPVTSTGTLALGLAAGYQAFTTAQSTKLAGIATAATANQTDAYLLARANHTGTQAIATVAGLQAALDGKATAAQGALADSAVQPAGLTKAAVGLGNVDNTSDLAKPVSTATQTALNAKAGTAVATTTVNGLMSAADKVKSDALADLAFKDSVSVADIDATGIPSDSTYLRGDGTWAPAGGGGGGGQVNTVGAGTGIAVNATDPINPSVALNPASIASLAKADTALQALTAGANITITGTGTARTIAATAAPQVNSDWTATTGVAEILNKPTLGTAAAQNVGAFATAAQGGKADTALQTLTQGANITITGTGTGRTIAATVPAAPVTSVAGKTGVVTLVKADVGLANVDNTSDANKPISTATQTALNGKASTAAVTTTVNGLMIAADKVKLNGIEAGAQVNVIPTKAQIGLGNVDNTSDANKPLSTAQAQAITDRTTTGGQWVTPTRSQNTVYQNTTGRPIFVSLDPSGETDAHSLEVSEDGSSNWERLGLAMVFGSDVRQGCWPIPPNFYYRLSGTGPYSVRWLEYR